MCLRGRIVPTVFPGRKRPGGGDFSLLRLEQQDGEDDESEERRVLQSEREGRD